jgi:hypothetical protein
VEETMNKRLLIYAITFTSMVSNVYASTEVGGIIDTNTVWTVEDSPYILTTDVQLAYGATLTIEPNVVISGNGLSIKVWGILDADGNAESRVVFNNVFIRGGIGNSSTTPHRISVKFSEISGGSIYGQHGNPSYGRLVLQDSILRNNVSYSELWYPTSDCYIERNIFNETCGGINAGVNNGVKVYIRNNVFYQQSTDYAVENWASYGTSEMIVRYNSFLSNDRIALRLPSGYTNARMTASENYWNTTNTSIIDSMIYDKKDDLGCAGYIVYVPILTEPDPNTPVFVPEPPQPVCLGKPVGDFNGDCKVDFADFAVFTSHWLECNLEPPEACWE